MKTDIEQTILTSLCNASKLAHAVFIDPKAHRFIADLSAALCLAFCNGGKALICGNGGSMADAMHFAEEFVGKFREDRPPLPVIALSDSAAMSCISNDYGFDYVFSRQVKALGRSDDVLLLLSTSGNSLNLSQAAFYGVRAGLRIFALLGGDGGKLKHAINNTVDFYIAPGDTADRIQEVHMLILHTVVECAENLTMRVEL